MKKLLFLIIILIPLGGCATTYRGSGKYALNGGKKTNFFERVGKKFKRKPLSRRKKYQRPMGRICYWFEKKERSVMDSHPMITLYPEVELKYDCGKHTYNKK